MKIWRWTKEIIIEADTEKEAREVLEEVTIKCYGLSLWAACQCLRHGELKQLWPVPPGGNIK